MIHEFICESINYQIRRLGDLYKFNMKLPEEVKLEQVNEIVRNIEDLLMCMDTLKKSGRAPRELRLPSVAEILQEEYEHTGGGSKFFLHRYEQALDNVRAHEANAAADLDLKIRAQEVLKHERANRKVMLKALGLIGAKTQEAAPTSPDGSQINSKGRPENAPSREPENLSAAGMHTPMAEPKPPSGSYAKPQENIFPLTALELFRAELVARQDRFSNWMNRARDHYNNAQSELNLQKACENRVNREREILERLSTTLGILDVK